MRRFSLLFCLTLALTLLAVPVSGAVHRQATAEVTYTFGEQVNFRLLLADSLAVHDVQIFMRSQGDEQPLSAQMTLDGNQAVYVQDLTSQPLRAFSTVEYWFTITPQSGQAYTTVVHSFLYVDNRFQWQTVQDGVFRVHWYEGDSDFGPMVLEAANEGAERARSLLPVGEIQPIELYVYASGKELQSTLRLGGLDWVAGHADPDLNLMVVSLPAGPDQKLETKRQISHELMHILLYQAVGAGYVQVPTWFKEGIASANEPSANPDYYLILTRAVADEALISLGQFCESFPQDSTVYLAYAEADSFVRYLHANYGSSGLNDLLHSYAGGGGCELGSQAALGLPLSGLENDWRREALGDFKLQSALLNMLPWLVILALVILAPLALFLLNLRKKAGTKDSRVSYG